MLSSNTITTRLKGRASKVAQQISAESLSPDLGYTIGSSIIFPGNRIDVASTINGARGFHPRIADRFDLTLECIRRHYRGESSPLPPTLLKCGDFFGLFESFLSMSSPSYSTTCGTVIDHGSDSSIVLTTSQLPRYRRRREISSTTCRRTMSSYTPETFGFSIGSGSPAITSATSTPHPDSS